MEMWQSQVLVEQATSIPCPGTSTPYKSLVLGFLHNQVLEGSLCCWGIRSRVVYERTEQRLETPMFDHLLASTVYDVDIHASLASCRCWQQSDTIMKQGHRINHSLFKKILSVFILLPRCTSVGVEAPCLSPPFPPMGSTGLASMQPTREATQPSMEGKQCWEPQLMIPAAVDSPHRVSGSITNSINKAAESSHPSSVSKVLWCCL